MLAHTQIYFISPSSIFVISYHKLLTISRLKNSYDFFYHLTDNRLIISVLLLLHREIIITEQQVATHIFYNKTRNPHINFNK